MDTNQNDDSHKVSISDLKSKEPKFHWKYFAIWVGVITALFVAIWFSDKHLQDDKFFIYMAPFQGVFGGLFYYGGYVWLRRIAYRSMLKKVTVDSVEEKAEILQEDLEQDFFNNLVKINFKYIDKYYLQTQIQADKAFTMSAAAALLGFTIIIVGIIQMYFGKLEPAYVTTAAGLTSEFIAAVFFYLYSKTIIRMSDYHRKLVLTQNVGLALRITQDLPDAERVKTQITLVERLSQDINQYLANETKES